MADRHPQRSDGEEGQEDRQQDNIAAPEVRIESAQKCERTRRDRRNEQDRNRVEWSEQREPETREQRRGDGDDRPAFAVRGDATNVSARKKNGDERSQDDAQRRSERRSRVDALNGGESRGDLPGRWLPDGQRRERDAGGQSPHGHGREKTKLAAITLRHAARLCGFRRHPR